MDSKVIVYHFYPAIMLFLKYSYKYFQLTYSATCLEEGSEFSFMK